LLIDYAKRNVLPILQKKYLKLRKENLNKLIEKIGERGN